MAMPSLLEMAIETVFDNIENYDKDLVNTCIAPLRQKMLKKMTEIEKNHYWECDGKENYIGKLWAILPFVIKSKSYTTLDIKNLTRMNCESCTLPNSRFQEFIRCLGSNTPNLKKLVISSKYDNSLGERELESIIQLKNLTILEIIGVDVPLSGILDISRRCEKLEMIKATHVIVEEEPSIIAFRNDFVFVYIDACHANPGRMDLLIQTTMPTWDPTFAAHKRYTDLALHEPKQNRDFLLAARFAKNLKNIDFDSSGLEDIEEMVEFLHLPEVKYATIKCGGGSAHALRCFMKRNGQSLQELNLYDVGRKEKMTFSEIFSLCPNLHSLKLIDCTFSGNGAPVDAMQQLKRFEWQNCKKRDSNVEVAFSSILSAPLLEHVFVNLPKIDFRDNATVIARINRRDILQNLKRFGMYQTTRFISKDEFENPSLYWLSFVELRAAISSANSGVQSAEYWQW